MFSFLTGHLKDAGEGYFQHMFYALKMSFWIVASALALMVHAIFPWWFLTTCSDNIAKIRENMTARANITKKNMAERLKKINDK